MECNLIKYSLLISLIIDIANTYNVSPLPNIIFTQPSTLFPASDNESYFGYSIVLRRNNVMIGAPRSPPTNEKQRNIVQPGAVYRCYLSPALCKPFEMEINGNVLYEKKHLIHHSEIRDNQWLGAAMDGSPSNHHPFIVCAPRAMCPYYDDLSMHGICYWVENTVSEKPLKVHKLKVFNDKDKQVFHYEVNRVLPDYSYAMMGISVKISEDNKEFIIGAPGVRLFSGSVVIHQLSEENRKQKKESLIFLKNKEDIQSMEDLFLYNGYSVTSKSLSSNYDENFYLAAAHRAQYDQGVVTIMQRNANGSLNVIYEFVGEQMGANFGYTMLAEDFTSDGLIDIAISAPYYNTSNGDYNNGVVMVFINIGDEQNMDFSPGIMLKGEPSISGQCFGLALGEIGDINLDGYNDLAVGAPFGEPAVYIFHGSPDGIITKPRQILVSPYSGSNSGSMFGMSISRGVDIDDNGYNDIAIGDPGKNCVYLYKSYPVIKFIPQIELYRKDIKISNTTFEFLVCWKLEFGLNIYSHENDRNHIVSINLEVDKYYNRAFFVKNKLHKLNFTAVARSIEGCETFEVQVNVSKFDSIYKAIDIELTYHFENDFYTSYNPAGHGLIRFLDNKFVLDPRIPKVFKEKVTFHTGCKRSVCAADLVISNGNQLPKHFIVGSSKHLILNYVIHNKGERAYVTQIAFNISHPLTYLRIPPVCTQIDEILNCIVLNGRPLLTNSTFNMYLYLDTTKLTDSDEEIVIDVKVSSIGNEINPDDNVLTNIIPLETNSQILFFGNTSNLVRRMDDTVTTCTIKYDLEFQNLGPSPVRFAEASLFIPYIAPNGFPVITNVTAMSVTSFVPNYNIGIFGELYLNNSLDNHIPSEILLRTYPQLRKLSRHNIHNRQNIENQLLESLPSNKTLIIECDPNKESTEACVEIRIPNIRHLNVNEAFKMNISLTLHLDTLGKYLNETIEYVAVKITPVFSQNSKISKSLNVQYLQPIVILRKTQLIDDLTMYVCLSTIIGFVILAILTYGFKRCGFFERNRPNMSEPIEPTAPSKQELD